MQLNAAKCHIISLKLNKILRLRFPPGKSIAKIVQFMNYLIFFFPLIYNFKYIPCNSNKGMKAAGFIYECSVLCGFA